MKCKVLRYRMGAALDENQPLSQRLEHHLTQCAECAAWCRKQRILSDHLRQVLPAGEAPPFLQRRIMRAIETSAPAEPVFRIWRLAIPTAAVAAVAGLVMGFRRHVEPEGLAHLVPPNPPSLSATESPSPALAISTKNSWFHAAAALDRPLRREYTLLKMDGLNTLRALQAGFIPNNLFAKKD